MTHRLREYLEFAARKGFRATILGTSGSGHLKTKVIGPRGIPFECVIPKSGSSNTGPRNWIHTLRRIEATLQEEKEMPLTLQERNEHRARILNGLMKDGLKLFNYHNGEGKGQNWHLSKNGSMKNSQPGYTPVSAVVANELITEGLIESLHREDRKEFFRLTEKGFNLFDPSIPPEPKAQEPENPITGVASGDILGHVPALSFSGMSKAELLSTALEVLEGMSTEEIRAILYYGLSEQEDDLRRKGKILLSAKQKLGLL